MTSLAAAFFLCPEIDPVLTLSISDIPVHRQWPMGPDGVGKEAWVDP